MSLFESERDQEMYYLDVVSEILEDVLNQSDDVRTDDLFSANQIPEITVKSYMQRLKSKSQCSNDTLIMSLIYIDKYTQADVSFRLSHYSIHRLLLVSLLTAAKIHEDFYYDNDTWAKAGGVPLRHLNELQLHFLKILEFRAFILPDEFNQYKSKIFDVAQG